MFNQEIYKKKKELMNQIDEIIPTKSVNILFNSEENFFLCYFCDDGLIDYSFRIYIDEKTYEISLKNNLDFELKLNFTRWFNTKGKILFVEVYKLLKLLSSDEQSDFNFYY